jgi:hypothetical protein
MRGGVVGWVGRYVAPCIYNFSLSVFERSGHSPDTLPTTEVL